MDYLHFLDFPVTIRQQIYTDLLVPPIVQHDDGSYSQDRAYISIMYSNRQIYAESSDIFYAKNLFVTVSSNASLSLRHDEMKKIPLFLEVKDPSRISQCCHFAMDIEAIRVPVPLRHTDVYSTPKFVISAAALPHFADAFRGHTIRFQTKETFRYTASRFSDLTYGRFLFAKRLPQFCALAVEGSIRSDHYDALMAKCIYDEELSCAQYYMSIRCIRDRVWFRMRMENKADSEGIKREVPEDQIHVLLRVLLRQMDVFWGCHEYRSRELGHNCSFQTWFYKVADLYELLGRSYLLAAKRHPTHATSAHFEARRAAEEGIRYLRRRDWSSDAESDIQPDRESISCDFNPFEARLSLLASKACAKLGDRAAAEAYIKDAATYAPQMLPTEWDRLNKLAWMDLPELPEDSPHLSPAVLWAIPGSQESADE